MSIKRSHILKNTSFIHITKKKKYEKKKEKEKHFLDYVDVPIMNTSCFGGL